MLQDTLLSYLAAVSGVPVPSALPNGAVAVAVAVAVLGHDGHVAAGEDDPGPRGLHRDRLR